MIDQEPLRIREWLQIVKVRILGQMPGLQVLIRPIFTGQQTQKKNQPKMGAML